MIGGAATVMFAMVTAIGIQTLRKASVTDNHNLLIVAVAPAVGSIPTIQPAFDQQFSHHFQMIFGSSITSTVIVVFVLNLVLNEIGGIGKRRGMMDTAMAHGAVATEQASAARCAAALS